MEKVLQKKTPADAKQEAPVIEIKNVKKIYRMGSERICAVDDVSFEINKGEFCCLLGTSGSGKSTLLNLMAGIEKASGGQILIKGRDVRKMSEKQLAKFRQKYLGFVFQSYNLLNSMTALENVEFPLVFKRVPSRKRRRMAKDMLIKVGLGGRINHRPKQMSGGQQQRVGIARAFVAKPEIVFADEPTGNLDTRTTMEVMKLIKQIARDNRQTIVMVTHDPRLADFADKIIHILDGKIQSVELIEHPIDSFDEAGADGGAQNPAAEAGSAQDQAESAATAEAGGAQAAGTQGQAEGAAAAGTGGAQGSAKGAVTAEAGGAQGLATGAATAEAGGAQDPAAGSRGAAPKAGGTPDGDERGNTAAQSGETLQAATGGQDGPEKAAAGRGWKKEKIGKQKTKGQGMAPAQENNSAVGQK